MRKAIITGAGEPLKLVDSSKPEVPPKGAVIRTLYAGVCHSDLHYIKDESDMGHGRIFRYRSILGDKFAGVTLGHEICGIIEQIGAEADTEKDALSVGDQVCVYPWIGCQECGNCKFGFTNCCPTPGSVVLDIGMGPKYAGGYATHVAVPKTCFLVKVPMNVPMSVACMLPCSAATTYASLKKASSAINRGIEVRGNSSILIIGAGGLGLWCTQLAKKTLFPEKLKITVADISEDKIKPAEEAGADDVIIWDKGTSPKEMMLKVTNGGKEPFDAVINFVGNPTSCQVGMMSLIHGGLQIVIGLFGGHIDISLPFMVGRSISIIGSKTSTLSELRELVGIISDKGLEYTNIQFFPLNEVNLALKSLETGKITGRALIKYDEGMSEGIKGQL